jgi:hypothetical protein
MLADVGVDTLVWHHQPFYRASSHQMRGNNLSHIGIGDVAIPDRFRIYDHGRPMFALIQASRLVDADTTFKSSRIDGLFEFCL